LAGVVCHHHAVPVSIRRSQRADGQIGGERKPCHRPAARRPITSACRMGGRHRGSTPSGRFMTQPGLFCRTVILRPA